MLGVAITTGEPARLAAVSNPTSSPNPNPNTKANPHPHPHPHPNPNPNPNPHPHQVRLPAEFDDSDFPKMAAVLLAAVEDALEA